MHVKLQVFWKHEKFSFKIRRNQFYGVNSCFYITFFVYWQKAVAVNQSKMYFHMI